MKKTALNQIHKDAGAKMVDFAGFEMPVTFAGIQEEHMTVRKKVGIFDVSHMGEFRVRGSQSEAFVQKVTTNDVRLLAPGQAQYSCFPNDKGGIVDDLLVYLLAPEDYLLVVNAANIEKDWKWISNLNNCGAELENCSDQISQLAVQGPLALAVMQQLTAVELDKLRYYTFTVDSFAGVDDVIISATGYTGSGGFELYFPNEFASKIYMALLEAGKAAGIQPIGLGARDTLRLEMGYCLYGNDIDDTTSPIEAGLGWITRFAEGNDFIGRDVFLMQKNEGVTRRLRGFKLTGRGIPRHGYVICDDDGHEIGHVTSGTMSPVLKQGIGMGYVQKSYSAIGTTIFIQIRNKRVAAEIVKIPFR